MLNETSVSPRPSVNLHTWMTPNGRKISILLEELGLPYRVLPVNLDAREQFAPAFLALSPNNKIPVIVDHDVSDGPIVVFESGAILTYLAEKTGRFLAPRGGERYAAIEWLHWSIGGLGPMLGQLNFFAAHDESGAALWRARFTSEVERLLGVLNLHLTGSAYVAGADYTIADIAAFTWIDFAIGRLESNLDGCLSDKLALRQWFATVAKRPAVIRGLAVPREG